MMDREGLGDLPTFDMESLSRKPMVMMDEQDEDDYQYITRMYGPVAGKVLEYIEDACDQLEYKGSMMFDEYLDRTGVLVLADHIYDKIKEMEKEDCIKKDRLLYQMVCTLLGGELYHRRCRYRRKCRIFYGDRDAAKQLEYSCFAASFVRWCRVCFAILYRLLPLRKKDRV